ncbi:type II toxin-antitoxin system Phd/YefM family antitoxin [Enterovirga sp. GCM10030262]|uniref:type II toxin-antitoxin system Phd/YefM family antitoxin n=1 Tax=Enterovirga sp. GCM10030262 TaxID=3273391 RepID=UPI00360B7E55
MNAPFQSEVVTPILAGACVGISELKKNPAAVIAAAREQQVAILNRNKPVAYMISPEVWDYLCELVSDQKLVEMAREALDSGEEGVPVTMDELLD